MADVIDPAHLADASSLPPLPIFLVDVRWNGFEWDAELYPHASELQWVDMMGDSFWDALMGIPKNEPERAKEVAIKHLAMLVEQRRLRGKRYRAFFSNATFQIRRNTNIDSRSFGKSLLENIPPFIDFYRENRERVVVTEVVREGHLLQDGGTWKLPGDAEDRGWVVSTDPPPKEYIAKFLPPPPTR